MFHSEKIVLTNPVWIVGDGAIATQGVGEGKLFPVVILDTKNRSDVAEYIRIHEFSDPGDVSVTWGKIQDRDDIIALILQFQRPLEFSLSIGFELKKAHGILIEAILNSGGLYIQAGIEGNRVMYTMNQPKVIIEVPDTGFRPRWNKIYLNFLAKKARSEGADRKSAKRLAAAQHAMLREMASARPFAR